MAADDEPSGHNPDLEMQQQQPPPLTTEAGAGACGWWHEQCRAKLFSFPGALALVFVLAAGVAQLAVWADHLDYVFSAFSVLDVCVLASLLARFALPDPDGQLDCCVGRRRPRLVLAWAREVAGYVAACSALIMFLVTLVMLLAMLLAVAESRAPAEWTAKP